MNGDDRRPEDAEAEEDDGKQKKRTPQIYPSVDDINALPEKFRQYIHDLETRCDKSGDVQTIALLREDRDALQKRVEELEAVIELLNRPNRIA
jgi:hypothetical protein